jgi:hypothetical protein
MANAFAGSVQNVGNITLTNVVVMVQNGEASQKLLGPIELAPNESAPFAGSAPSDAPVIATAMSLCHGIPVSDSADCGGSVQPTSFRLTPVASDPNAFTLTWDSISGRWYRVESKDSLSDSKWQRVGADVQATSAVTQQTDTQPPSGPGQSANLLRRREVRVPINQKIFHRKVK